MFKLPEEIIKGLEDYKKSLAEFLDGSLSAARFKGIRVPWGIYNQRGGKSYMVRIRVVSGSLDPDQLKALADASKKYGNGILHVTTRQDIQIHDVKIEDTINILEQLEKYNLSSRGGGGNTVRNITTCPLAGLCDDEIFDTRPYVEALSEHLLKDPDSYVLPRKFKIAFSGCGRDCGLATVNDLGFIAKEKDAVHGFSVYAGGGMGSNPKVAALLEKFIGTEDAAYTAEAVKRVFFNHGERKDRHRARLRFLVEKIGFDKFKELYKGEIEELRASEHIALRKIEYGKEKNNLIIEIRLPLGDIPSEKAEGLAGLAKIDKGIRFRTSQHQNIYIVNVPDKAVKEINNQLKKLGLDLPHASTAKDIVCCAGATTCNLGFCNSRGLASELEKTLEGLKIKEKLLKGITVNVNGCPNCCGQHPIGTIGLHGLARKVGAVRVVPFYRVSIGGRVEEGKTVFGLDAGVVPARNVPLLIKDFFVAINGKFHDGADIHQLMVGEGLSAMKDLAKKYAYVPAFEEDISFYKDWGKDEVFSLAGLTQGECGAGVIDMIESDLADAKKDLVLAREKGFDIVLIKESLYLSSRALLIVKGIEPKAQGEAISAFEREFIAKGIASGEYKDISRVFKEGIADKNKFYSYAEGFYNEVKKIYASIDSSFNFPTPGVDTGSQHPVLYKVLDLKGVACPLNYVKTKIFLEGLSAGEVIDVYLDEGDPIANVPKSLESDGQEILGINKKDGYYIVTVKKLK